MHTEMRIALTVLWQYSVLHRDRSHVLQPRYIFGAPISRTKITFDLMKGPHLLAGSPHLRIHG